MENDNIFIGKTFKLGDSIVITIPARNATYEGIKAGDTLKVKIAKIKEAENNGEETNKKNAE